MSKLKLGQFAWCMVHHANFANVVPFARRNGRARIKPDARLANDQGIVKKSFVRDRIGNDKHVGFENRVSTKRNVSRSFGKLESDPRFEPLAVRINQRYEPDRRSADRRDELGDIIEINFWFSIEDLRLDESLKPLRFVLWFGRRLHRAQ